MKSQDERTLKIASATCDIMSLQLETMQTRLSRLNYRGAKSRELAKSLLRISTALHNVMDAEDLLNEVIAHEKRNREKTQGDR